MQSSPKSARDHLHGAVVVRRPEPAGHETRVRRHTFAQRGFELVRRVADDDDPRRLEAEPERLRGEERAVAIGALATYELAAGDDDDRPRTGGHAPARAVRDGLTSTCSVFRDGSETVLPLSVRRKCVGWRMRIQKRWPGTALRSPACKVPSYRTLPDAEAFRTSMYVPAPEKTRPFGADCDEPAMTFGDDGDAPPNFHATMTRAASAVMPTSASTTARRSKLSSRCDERRYVGASTNPSAA